MTLRQHSSLNNHTNDATFRAVCQTFHDSFMAAGMVQAADTGQINLTTVLRPVAASTLAGYEIWRFNDALATEAPIYFKFEYWTASTTTLGLWVTTGTGSDGTGAITVQVGTPTTRKQIAPGTTSSGGIFLPSYFNYLSDGSGFAFVYWPAGTSFSTCYCPVLVIERFRNHDGTPNADGWNVLYGYCNSASGNANSDARFYSIAAIQPTGVYSYWPVPSFPTSVGNYVASTVFDGTLYPVPVFTGSWPRIGGPSQLVLGVGRHDLPAGTTVQVSHYGEMHSWIAVGSGSVDYGWGQLESQNKLTSFLIRAD